VSFRTIRRAGAYFRVADPTWENPLAGRHAQAAGGRWNPPDSFPVVYLNRDVPTARANVTLRFEGRPYQPEDLDPAEAPVLVTTDVPENEFVDVVTDAGCVSAGLPASYPRDANGGLIGRNVCQPIGQRAHDERRAGVACRSAAPRATRRGEELAWFERGDPLAVLERRRFDEWYWPT
jgi:hypothetical protein